MPPMASEVSSKPLLRGLTTGFGARWAVGVAQAETGLSKRLAPFSHISFLGYDPNPEPRTLGERIKAKRRREGLTLREVALRLEVDLGTVMAWEKDEVRKPFPRYVRLFEQFVEGV